MRKKFRIFLSLLIVAALLFQLPAISSAKGKVKLNKTKATVTIGDMITLQVKNTTKSVKWSSSKKSVASVNSYGEVTAKKAGTAKITAKVAKKKYTCQITVPKQGLSENYLFIKVGEQQKIDLQGVSGDDYVFWTSDYEYIAEITQSGKVTANSVGMTTVYAIINSGVGKTYKCDVVVYDENESGEIVTATPTPAWTPQPSTTPDDVGPDGGTAVTKVEITDKKIFVSVMEARQLKTVITPESALNKNVTWSSANTEVARVGSNGTVTGIAPGSTIVYVTTADGEFVAVCEVTVTGTPTPSPSPSVAPTASPSPTVVPTPTPSVIPVSKVTLSQKTLQLETGKSSTLVAQIIPLDATNQNVIWKSGNESIVTVDSSGTVFAVSAGSTVVYVTTEDGEFVAVCVVTVTGAGSTADPSASPTTSASPSPTASASPTADPGATVSPSPTPLTLSHTSLELAEGQSKELTVSGAVGDVTWTSSDSAAVTVDKGLVKAEKESATPVTITATASNGSATCSVTVIAKEDADPVYDGNGNETLKGISNITDATELEISDSVTKIGQGALKDAKKLWKVTFDGTSALTEIEEEAFSGCENLQEIELPDTVETIGARAFAGCENLEKITLPEGITEIPEGAFEGCTSLKEITILGSVTSIAEDAFKDCKNLTIRGVAGSEAERWATEQGFEFLPIEDEDEES